MLKCAYINLEEQKDYKTQISENITGRECFKTKTSNIILDFDKDGYVIGIEIIDYVSISEEEIVTPDEINAGVDTVMTYDERLEFLKNSGLGELYGVEQDGN